MLTDLYFIICSVNIGGLLLPEPFIAPSLFEPFANNSPSNATYPGPAVDEYTLMQNLNLTNNVNLLIQHYETFIVGSFSFIALVAASWRCFIDVLYLRRLRKISRKSRAQVLILLGCLLDFGRLILGQASLSFPTYLGRRFFGSYLF